MELEPKYVDLAIQRWQTLTGEKAIHKSTGQTFAAREAMTSAANKENSHE